MNGQKQKRRSRVLARSVLAMIMSACAMPLQATPPSLLLSTAPAGTDHKPPAPNVVVSVDNSGSMESKGIPALREALKATFSAMQIPDGAIRLAWQATTGTDCHELPSAKCGNLNGMKVLDSAHRHNFMQWLDGLKPHGDTPSHRMLRNAGEYLKKPIDIDSAWASVPGKMQEPVLGCRRAYNLFLTDGGWNETVPGDHSRGDADGTQATLPDGELYDPASPASAIFRGSSKSQAESTLSDLAFHYWMTDLQPTLVDNVQRRIKAGGDATFTSTGVTRTIPEYWNPRNDPATWQHMSTYTVDFGTAAGGTVKPRFGSDTWTGGDYDSLITGVKTWPDPIAGSPDDERITELWHMAINSRGQFIPAQDPKSLIAAFKGILDQIISDRTSALTSLSVSSRSTRLGSSLFAAGYNAANWTGHVTAYKIAADTAAVEPGGLWGTDKASEPNSTATLMDAKDETWPSSRLVLSASTASKTSKAVGISWEWAQLLPDAKTALMEIDTNLDTPKSEAGDAARDRMAYLRGDRSKEQSRTPAGPFRNRGSRHGDIVNSKLWYLAGQPSSAYMQENYAAFRAARSSRPSMLYVGANDGMLHGFDAATGEEKIAYVPEGLNARLAELTHPAYSHAYYVDGSPLTGDLYVGAPGSHDVASWRTYLAGFLGAGGKGYFVLDVTDPDMFNAANAASLVVADRTAAVSMDPDIGHIFSEPVMEASDPSISRQITQMNNGRWALVMGNGYNSTGGKAVLLIQYLDKEKELVKITTDAAAGNGLSAPRLVDLNGDRIPDVAYAGDLRGNLWKFDLGATSASGWGTAFSKSPLFVAEGGASPPQRQPITSAPVWKAHPEGGLMLAFGTGRNLTIADRSDKQQQTIYGIHDDTPITRNGTRNPLTGTTTVTLTGGNAVRGGRSQLVAQTVGADTTTTTEAGSPLWTVSSNPVAYSGGDARRGWFLDLPADRERVLQNPGWFGGDLIDVASTVPAEGAGAGIESCDPSVTMARGYRTLLNIVNGSAPKSRVYAEAAESPAASAAQASRVETSGSVGIRNDTKELSVAPPGMKLSSTPALLGKVTKRPSWRQLQ